MRDNINIADVRIVPSHNIDSPERQTDKYRRTDEQTDHITRQSCIGSKTCGQPETQAGKYRDLDCREEVATATAI